MKKLISVFLSLILIAALSSGCASSGTSSADKNSSGSTQTKKGGEINLFIWTEYMPQNVLDKFYEETGTKVNVTTFSSLADMYAKVKSSPAGTYDVVDSAGFYIPLMVKENLLEKFDKDNLPNLKNISSVYLKLNEQFDTDNAYSIPYQAVAAALCYNKSLYPKGVKSYEDLFNSDLKNSIVLLNDPRAIIGTVNAMLGYDFNETDSAKLEKTKEKLLELKSNVKVLDSDSPKTALISGECSVGLIYTAEIALAQEENPDIEIVYPDKGEYFGMDSLCIAKGCKNKELSENFLNFIMKADIGKMISEEFQYINPNSAALKLLSDDYKNNPAKNVPETAIAKGMMPTDIGKTVDVYNDIWTEFTK